MCHALRATAALAALALALGCGAHRPGAMRPGHEGMAMPPAATPGPAAAPAATPMGSMPGMAGMAGMPGMPGMPGMAPGAHLHLPYLTADQVEQRYRFRVTSDPAVPRAGQPVRLDVFIHDALGRPVDTLQVHHERLAHFLVVAENLEEFHHLHAEDAGLLTDEARGQGRFSFSTTLGWGGRYLLSIDAVDGGFGVHKELWLGVDGPPQPPTRWNLTADRRRGDIEARLRTNPFTLEAQVLTVGTYQVEARGAPASDLEPYLGALAHLAIFGERARSSAHNHGGGPEFAPFLRSQPVPGYRGPKIYFEHTFRDPGRYRIFTQIQRAGTVYTLPFDVEVAPRAASILDGR